VVTKELEETSTSVFSIRTEDGGSIFVRELVIMHLAGAVL